MKPAKCTVLLVDDDPAVLRGIRRNLRDDAFEVLTAVSAAEAAVILRRSPIDVIVCDQRMPGLTGIDFLTRVRQEKPGIATIILSGHVSGLPIAMRAASEIGVHQILSKPCSVTDLAQTIREAFRTSRENCPQSGEPLITENASFLPTGIQELSLNAFGNSGV